MKINPFQWINKLPLQIVLTVPLTLQVVLSVTIVGYLSLRNGQNAVDRLVAQLQTEIASKILQQLSIIVERPHAINQMNANSLRRGDLNLVTGKGENQLWQQTKIFESTNLIYCATEADGNFLGVGRSLDDDNRLQVHVANQTTKNHIYYYDIDEIGNRTILSRKGTKYYDPRQRPWYESAKTKGAKAWSDIYLDFDTELPTITAVIPVFDIQQSFVGVCATDIILPKELNLFLRNLKIGKSGISFILDLEGNLIASSVETPIVNNQQPEQALLPAIRSQNALIRQASQVIQTQNLDTDKQQAQQVKIDLNNQKYYLQVVQFRESNGLNWTIVLLVPAQDFMEEIQRNTNLTLIFCVLTLVLSVILGFLMTRWLTQPLMQLSATAKDIANGDWDKAIELDRVDAIGDLSRSFSRMAQQLQRSFLSLEKRIEERTEKLVHLNRELHRLAHIDGLTEIANRRYFDQFLLGAWHKLSLLGEPLSLILCDVDYFKRYNDTYGHQQGDICLQKVAYLLSQVVDDPAYLVARYGGEEFAVVLPRLTLTEAVIVAEKIQEAVHDAAIEHRQSESKIVTLSLGIGTMIPTAKTYPNSLVTASDLALYMAKSQGRNRYYAASESAYRTNSANVSPTPESES